MVLDPFSAIGLAGNVVHFLAFGTKLISESHNIYASAIGATTGNIELELIYTDLEDLTKALEDPDPNSGHAVSINEAELRKLSASCVKVANELLTTVKLLKVDKNCKHRKWRSFRQALKFVWKQSDIDGLQARLGEFRSQLTLRIVVILG